MEIGQLFEWQCFYLLGPETKRGRMGPADADGEASQSVW